MLMSYQCPTYWEQVCFVCCSCIPLCTAGISRTNKIQFIMDRFLTVKEACREYKLSRSTIYKMRKRNLIKWYALTPKKVLILKNSLDKYLESKASFYEHK